MRYLSWLLPAVPAAGVATGTAAAHTTGFAGGMGMLPQFSPDGSRIYLTVRDLATDSGFGDGPMHQGDAPTGAMLMSTTVIAVDSGTGATLWSVDLARGQ